MGAECEGITSRRIRTVNAENNVWAQRGSDGMETAGLNAYVASLASLIISYTQSKGRFCATLESDKWVNTAKTLVAGEVAEIRDVVNSKPGLINEVLYATSWLVKIKLNDWDAASDNIKMRADLNACARRGAKSGTSV